MARDAPALQRPSRPWLATAVRPWLIYVVGFIPAVSTFVLGVQDKLGADPVKVLEHTLGLWALRFLILTLMITPLNELTPLRLLRYRRALGLMAFWYACLHLTTYLVLDQSLNLAAIGADIVRRPYITIGMAALLMMAPLAATSNNLSIRKLGKKWRQLHRLIYLAAAAAAVHFIMVVKSWPPEPLIYAGIVAVLLGYRLVPLRLRRKNGHRIPQATTPPPTES